MKYYGFTGAECSAGLLCAALLAAPAGLHAQETLTFATRLDVANISVSAVAPTDTGIFVPPGAEVSIAFGAGGPLAAELQWGESAVPFTLYAYLEGQEASAVEVRYDAPIRFEDSGQLRLAIGNVACGEIGGWGDAGAGAGITVVQNRIVTAQDGDRNAAWGLPIVHLAKADTLTIGAEGGVSYWEGGAPVGLAGEGKLSADALAPDVFINALVGLIGESAPFLIGTMLEGRQGEGWLWLSINDEIDKPGAFRNNSGTVSIFVEVTRLAGGGSPLAAACVGGETAVQEAAAAAGQPDTLSGGAAADLPIAPGQVLVTGQRYQTADGALRLVFREDGQLVVERADGNTIWSSLDAGAPAAPGGSVMVSFGGELAMFDAQRALVWAPVGDFAVPGSVLYIDTDQILKMLSPSWTVTWPQGVSEAPPPPAATPQPALATLVPAVPEAAPVTPLVPEAAEVAPAPVVERPAEEANDAPIEDFAEAPVAAPETPPQPAPQASQPMSATLTTMWRQGEGECLTIGQGREGLYPGAPAGMARCDGSAAQDWLIVPLGDGYAYIANTKGGSELCLTGGDGSAFAPRAAAVTAEPCAETPEQIWQILPQENGYFLLSVLAFGGMCLEGAWPGSETLGGGAFMDNCQDVSGQYWIDGAPVE